MYALPLPSFVAFKLALPSRIKLKAGTGKMGAPPDVRACLVMWIQPTLGLEELEDEVEDEVDDDELEFVPTAQLLSIAM